MVEATTIREPETTPVQLTRIEGIVNLVDYKVTNMIAQQESMKTDIRQLQSDVHTLQLEAAGRDKTAKTVAETLEKKEEENSRLVERKWSPLGRWYLATGAIYAVVSLWLLIHK